ncbi:unnamed protein product [Aureobasidium uvarum]|uniref:Uncharacterized protein n=1 Tax=Aureobasidium uvarum TaxID=2773716 RepID=A0A9N8PWW2_9PEZI|nr:unnamed protein product [Aureobasidium uvarum]
MAVPRDPNFWKRFSMAVHQDEEAQVDDQKSETWLITTRRKKRHSYARFCCTFWILLFAIIAIVVVVFLILIKTHTLQKIHIGGEGHKVDVDLDGWLEKLFNTGGGDKSKEGGGS